MVEKHTIIAIGCLISKSILLVIEFSTWLTSALILATMSPLLSAEKNANGSFITFLYTSILMSFTTPVRIGRMVAEPKKYEKVFRPVIKISPKPIMHSVTNAPYEAISSCTYA